MILRKLAASGYSLGEKLKIRGVEATCLSDPRGISVLIVSSVFYGPSWVQIHNCVKHLAPAPTLITLGSTPSVLVKDSVSTRELISGLFKSANASRAKQVHLEGVGFVELESKSKLEPKVLALPLISILCVLGLGIAWGNSQGPSQSAETPIASETCIVDSHQIVFDSWLSESLLPDGPLSFGQAIQKNTDRGDLDIVVEGIIGSAAKISGVASCSDGKQRTINHRVDTSGSGVVLELGQ